MKKLLLTLVLLVGIIFGLFAQKLTYQAVVRDNNQQLVVNTAVKATVTIDFATGEDPTWTVDATTNIHGLLSIEFGDATLKGRDWTGATIAVKVVNKNDESIVYVNDDVRSVSAVPYALSVDGQFIQNYLTANNYVDLAKLNDTLNAYPTTAVMEGRHYLTKDSTVITTMQSDIADLKAGQFDCNKVKDCIKDTLEKYTPTTDLCDVLNDCLFPEQTLAELLQGLTDQISDLKEQVDSLSNLPHGGGDTPTAFTCGTDKVKDVDNNEYPTVQIGSQCWMAQNLRTDVDGSVYPKNGDNYVTGDDTVTYGRLYTWAAMMKNAPSTNYPAVSTDTIVHGICPAGWHVPSDAEWDTLTKYVFSIDDYKCGSSCGSWAAQSNVSCIANALSSPTGWNNSSTTGCNAGDDNEKRNLTGFAAVPAGMYSGDNFGSFGYDVSFWSATEREDRLGNAWLRYLNSYSSIVIRRDYSKDYSYSVRCLRDAGIGGATPSTPATMSCDDVMNCLGDTLGKLNDKIVAQGAEIATLKGTVTEQGNTITTQGQTITEQGNTIDSLAHIVDSLSKLPHGGGTTEVADGQPCPGAQTVKDIDGNTYNTVKIGSQCWTKENMKTKKYADGTDIDNSKMFNPNDSEDNVATYGKLYTWYAATRDSSTTYPASGSKVQGICPAGWHVPSNAEWTQLTDYVNSKTEYRCEGTDNAIAKALASKTGWANYPVNCYVGDTPENNDATGFSAVPAGDYVPYNFLDFGNYTYFWSATEVEDDNEFALYRHLRYTDRIVRSFYDSKDDGFSVRCLRDAGIGGTTPSAPTTMSCDDVMRCMGDTLGKLNDKIVAQGQTITTQGLTIENLSNTVTEQNQTITEQGNTIDSLAHIVDSLSKLPHGGGDTPTAFTCGTDKVKDVQDNEYPTVQIGSQCWMAQNLRTKLGTDGDYGYPTSAGNDTVTYGRLYTWAAMMDGATSTNYPASGDKVQGICPAGWHVPSDAEWDTLTYYVYNSTEPDYKCSGCSTTVWKQSTECIAKALASKTGWNANGNNCRVGNTPENNDATGFSAVPAGYCDGGRFPDCGNAAYFWSATQYDGSSAWYRHLRSRDSGVDSSYGGKDNGYSVRCLRD